MARALSESIFTQADTLPELREQVLDAAAVISPTQTSGLKWSGSTMSASAILRDVAAHHRMAREDLLKELF